MTYRTQRASADKDALVIGSRLRRRDAPCAVPTQHIDPLQRRCGTGSNASATTRMLLSLSQDGAGAMLQTQAEMHWRCGAGVTRARVWAAAVPLPKIWVPRRGRWRKECGSFCGAKADGKWLARGAVWGGHEIASPRIGELLEASWTTSDQSTEPSGAISTASRRAGRSRRLWSVRESTTGQPGQPGTA